MAQVELTQWTNNWIILRRSQLFALETKKFSRPWAFERNTSTTQLNHLYSMREVYIEICLEDEYIYIWEGRREKSRLDWRSKVSLASNFHSLERRSSNIQFIELSFQADEFKLSLFLFMLSLYEILEWVSLQVETLNKRSNLICWAIPLSIWVQREAEFDSIEVNFIPGNCYSLSIQRLFQKYLLLFNN